MEEMKMSKEQFDSLYRDLMKLSEEYQKGGKGCEENHSQTFGVYDLNTVSGRQFYNQIKNEQLLDILRTEAKRLNHSPSQKEIFRVWREYIKKRFGKWPYALEAAGLKKAAGIGGKTLERAEKEAEEYEKLLQEVKKKAEELCRIPHPQEVPELCHKLKKYTDNWNHVIKDAGLDRKFFRKKSVYEIENLEAEYKEDLQKILHQAEILGRSPLKSEVDTQIKTRLIERCGSWRNVLYQIDLEPVVKINPFSATHISDAMNEKERTHKVNLQDCYYRILNPDEETLEGLRILNDLKQKWKRVPDKKEISPELRKKLQKSCGSWANALYQLEYMEKERKDYEKNDEENII